MECTRKCHCRCCYHPGELKMLSGLALDVFTLICHPQGLKDDETQIFACDRCHEFLKEVYCFRDEHHGDESENMGIKPHEVDLILKRITDENSAKICFKTEIIDEDVEMDQIDDIKNNKVEVVSDSETSPQMSEISRESLLVSNVEETEMEVHNSLNLNENSLLIELRAVPYIETSKSISRPLKRLGKVSKKSQNKVFKCNVCWHATTNATKLKFHIRTMHCDENRFSCDHCDYNCKKRYSLRIHMKKHFPRPSMTFKCKECSYEGETCERLKSHFKHVHSDVRTYSCDQCDSRFKTNWGLLLHGKVHSTNKTFKCNECPYEVKTSRLLKIHINQVHSGDRPFTCDHCSFSFKRKSGLIKHIGIQHSNREKRFKCNECSYKGKNMSHLKSHLLHKHSDEKPLSCDQCDYRCKLKSNLSRHKETHLDHVKYREKIKCNECSYEGKNRVSLKIHLLRKHSDGKPLSCDQCDFRCKLKSNLSRHKETHLDRVKYREKFKCNECSYKGKNMSHLKSHLLRKHSDEKPFSCDQCDFRSKSNSNLSQHKKAHLNRVKYREKYKCNECSYEGKNMSHLKSHLLHKHSDEKPLSCDQCDYRCKLKRYLSRHKETHLDHVKYREKIKCNECSYEGKNRYSLKLHLLRKHSDEKPFSCDQCDFRSISNSNLSQHKKTHLDRAKYRENFKCNECSYKGISAYNLRLHTKYKHTDERPFSCDQCDSRFKLKNDLSKHSKIHTNTFDARMNAQFQGIKKITRTFVLLPSV